MVDVNDLESSDAALTVTLTTGPRASHSLFNIFISGSHPRLLVLSLLLFWEIICLFGGSLHTVDTDFMLILWARVLVSSGSYLVSFLFSFHGWHLNPKAGF